MTIPASLLSNLRALVPGFEDEVLRDQMSLAQMLWMWTQSRRTHIEWEGMVSMSKQDIRNMWGADQRMREVVGGRYFRVLSGSNLGRGYTNGYAPRDHMAAALRECLLDPLNEEWIGDTGKVVRSLPRPIRSKSGDGKRKTKWRGSSPAACIEIDLESLQALRQRLEAEVQGIHDTDAGEDSCTDAHWRPLQAATDRLMTVDAIIKMSRNTLCPGSVPIRYVEQSTGRLFAEGLSLQSAPREIRNAALAGCWDYDISNCHWALVDQLALQHGYVCNAIRHYLANKSQVRNEIAVCAGITAKQAKECLLMVMYGAPASTFEEAAIPGLIGPKAARRLYGVPAFRRLHHDVRKARGVIISALPVPRGGWIVNALGLQISSKSKPKALLAHILQGLEAKALMAVVREYGDNVQLCVHDGWVARKRIDLGTVTCVIRQAIGLDVEVEEVELLRVAPYEALSQAALVDKSASSPQSQHPCGFPGDLAMDHATSSLTPVVPPFFDGQEQPVRSGLVLYGSPAWTRRPKVMSRTAGLASAD